MICRQNPKQYILVTAYVVIVIKMEREIERKMDAVLKIYGSPILQLIVIFALMSSIMGAAVLNNHIEDVVEGSTSLSYTVIMAGVVWLATFVMVLVYIIKNKTPNMVED